MPSLAIRDGLVVTPSRIPNSLASLICSRLAVSIKNFMLVILSLPVKGQRRKKMAGLPALGGFSRSWSCKTCRRKDKGIAVFFIGCFRENKRKENYLFFPFVFFVGVVSLIISSLVGKAPSGFVFIQIVLSIQTAGFDLSTALTVTFATLKSAGIINSLP